MRSRFWLAKLRPCFWPGGAYPADTKHARFLGDVMEQMTIWKKYDEPIRSQHGILGWETYLHAEIARIRSKAPEKLLEIRRDGAFVALFVEVVGGDSHLDHRNRSKLSAYGTHHKD